MPRSAPAPACARVGCGSMRGCVCGRNKGIKAPLCTHERPSNGRLVCCGALHQLVGVVDKNRSRFEDPSIDRRPKWGLRGAACGSAVEDGGRPTITKAGGVAAAAFGFARVAPLACSSVFVRRLPPKPKGGGLARLCLDYSGAVVHIGPLRLMLAIRPQTPPFE